MATRTTMLQNRIANRGNDQHRKSRRRNAFASAALIVSGFVASACGGVDRSIDEQMPINPVEPQSCSVEEHPAECAAQVSGPLTSAPERNLLTLGNLGFRLQSIGDDDDGEYAGIEVVDSRCNLVTAVRAGIETTTEFSFPDPDNPEEQIRILASVSTMNPDGSVNVTFEKLCEEQCPVPHAPDLDCSEYVEVTFESSGVITANGIGMLMAHIGEMEGAEGLFGVLVDTECIPLIDMQWFNEHEEIPLESTRSADGSILVFEATEISIRPDHGPPTATAQLTRVCP
jgi:hypothetical protein